MDFSDYKGIYVVAIPKYGEIQKVTGELIGASRELAAELNESVSVVLVGTYSSWCGFRLRYGCTDFYAL